MRKLGNIVITAGTSKNNNTTAVPFAIPAGCQSVALLTTGTDVFFELVPDPEAGLYETNTGRGFPMTANAALLSVPCFQPGGVADTIAAFSTAGATLQVWEMAGA